MSPLLKWIIFIFTLIIIGELLKYMVKKLKLHRKHRFFDYQQRHWKKEDGRWILIK